MPLLVLPFSTDQFAGAAAIERTGVGVCLDPNATTSGDIADAVRHLLAPGGASSAAAAIGEGLREVPGPQRARAAVRQALSG